MDQVSAASALMLAVGFCQDHTCISALEAASQIFMPCPLDVLLWLHAVLTNWALLIHGLANHVQNTTQGATTHRHLWGWIR